MKELELKDIPTWKLRAMIHYLENKEKTKMTKLKLEKSLKTKIVNIDELFPHTKDNGILDQLRKMYLLWRSTHTSLWEAKKRTSEKGELTDCLPAVPDCKHVSYTCEEFKNLFWDDIGIDTYISLEKILTIWSMFEGYLKEKKIIKKYKGKEKYADKEFYKYIYEKITDKQEAEAIENELIYIYDLRSRSGHGTSYFTLNTINRMKEVGSVDGSLGKRKISILATVKPGDRFSIHTNEIHHIFMFIYNLIQKIEKIEKR